MDLEFYLKDQINKLIEYNGDRTSRYEELYSFVKNENLKILFAKIHENLNSLFEFLYAKSRSNGHYNANESRELIAIINQLKDMKYYLKGTKFSFSINEDYEKLLIVCDEFLLESGGSQIPKKLPKIRIIEYDPIFHLNRVIEVPIKNDSYKYALKFIGSGSYAKVFKYKDEFYSKNVVIKRAKSDLDVKELERFENEFKVMKELKSPYVVEVFRYDKDNNEYYMECADTTLGKYIEKNNGKITIAQRKGMLNQIFRGIDYVHSKGYLHRDISYSNILLFIYDDVIVVKLSDFGLVKIPDSDLTSFNSDFKGSLNDPSLKLHGFKNYSIEHETYALTQLVVFLMTGKKNISNINEPKIKAFISRGLSPNLRERYHNVNDLKKACDIAFQNNI